MLSTFLALSASPFTFESTLLILAFKLYCIVLYWYFQVTGVTKCFALYLLFCIFYTLFNFLIIFRLYLINVMMMINH